MSYTDKDRVIALAGIYQAARLVRDIAREGQCNIDMSRASLNSLFDFSPASVEAVFGGEKGVASGLRTLISQLESPQQRDLEIAQYVIATIHLADKLRKAGQLDRIADELSALKQRIEEFDLPRPTRIAQVEHIYQEHVSTMQPQIMVRGEPLYLQNREHAGHIRAMLLCGIRSAILWRQCGGKKLQLLWSRNKFAAIARDILDHTVDD
jgi:high frequency lysogenization protein